MEPNKVSDDLSKLLSSFSGELPDDLAAFEGTLSEEYASAGFLRCVWSAGCQYCQRADGSWYLVRCIA